MMDGREKYAFILFHSGETRALGPTMRKMASEHNQYDISIIPVGQAALANLKDEAIQPYIHQPQFIIDGEGGNHESRIEFSIDKVQQVLDFCADYQNVVIGFPAKIQEQVAANLAGNKNRIIYFDSLADKDKIAAFAPVADYFIFTTPKKVDEAKTIINTLPLARKPTIIAGRHGDIDAWRERYITLPPRQKELNRKALNLNKDDKVIVWAGSYGHTLSEQDEEAQSFRLFIAALKEIQEPFQLRISIHPGLLKTYSARKYAQIIDAYYISALKKAGIPTDSCISSLSTIDTSSVACAIFSWASRALPPGVVSGLHCRNIPVDDRHVGPEGIGETNNVSHLATKIRSYLTKGRRQLHSPSFIKAMGKLNLPTMSTTEAVKQCAQTKLEPTRLEC